MCNRCSGFGQILLQTSCNLTKLQYFLSPANHGYAAKGKLFLMRLFLFLIFNGRGFGSKCWCRLQERFFWDWKKVGCRIRHLKSATKKVVVQPSSAVFHGILRFYFSWIWLASVYRLKKSKNIRNWQIRGISSPEKIAIEKFKIHVPLDSWSRNKITYSRSTNCLARSFWKYISTCTNSTLPKAQRSWGLWAE